MYKIENIKELDFDILDSTQVYLLSNIDNLDNLTFVRANNQTSGHGRMNRNWLSTGNNLLFSFLIKDSYLIERFASLSLLTGVAIFNSLKELGINDAKIKWPNDIYVNDKKIAGIILESMSITKIDAIAVGVGLNVNMSDFGELNATSIKEITKKDQDIKYIKNIVYKSIIDSINLFKENNNFYLDIIRTNNYLLNKRVKIYPNGNEQIGIVKTIRDDNSLEVEVDSKIVNVRSDEVFDLK